MCRRLGGIRQLWQKQQQKFFVSSSLIITISIFMVIFPVMIRTTDSDAGIGVGPSPSSPSSASIQPLSPLNQPSPHPSPLPPDHANNNNHHRQHHFHPVVNGNDTYYETVRIDDPAPDGSAGIYFRISQRGVDYLANLASDGLPDVLYRMVLPNIRESGFSLSDAMITKLQRPHIWVKFVPEYGVDLSVGLPELSITGTTELSFFFASYSAQMLAVLSNFTVQMRVHIHRQLNEQQTALAVTNCTVNPGTFVMKFYGPEANEFYAIADLIRVGLGDAIKDKICTLPPLVREFVHEKIQLLSQPPPPPSPSSPPDASTGESSTRGNGGGTSPSVFDHLCGPVEQRQQGRQKHLGQTNGKHKGEEIGDAESNHWAKNNNKERNDDDEAEEGGGEENANEKHSAPETDKTFVPIMQVDMAGLDSAAWIPDLTLHYPPTFSRRDLIFGIDGGFLYNGQRAPASVVSRPKFGNIEVRDQMLGLILSEYVPNTFFWHIFNADLGHVSVSYSYRHMPRVLRSVAKLVCPDCRVAINANLTTAPKALLDRNGLTLVLDGDIGAHFWRRNRTYNILSANGQLRVGIKPHFRHSRLYSDVLLSGVDFKVYRAGMDGIVAGAIRKMISFLIPRAIWPKIQQRLRLVVNHKGIQIPRLCSVEFQHLHLDYIPHAAIISGDFDVDLPLLIRSFKQFMDQKQRNTKTRRELAQQFRYF